MQQMIDLSKEAQNFLNEIKKPKDFGTYSKTVEEIYDMHKDGTLVRNTDYNRKYSWPPAIKKSYEYTLITKSIIPAIIVRRVQRHGREILEIIDGGHRVETIPKIIDNEIRLPISLLEELGGGDYYKNCHPDIKKAILHSKIIIFDLGNISDKEVSRIFCSLQNGQSLKTGQKIKGMQYGIDALCINEGLKSKLWDLLADSHIKNGVHYQIIVQCMVFEQSLRNSGKIPSRSEKIFKYVENDELPSDAVLVMKVVDIFNKLYEVLNSTVTNIRLQSLIRGSLWFLFIREHFDEEVEILSDFFDKFYENMSYVSKHPEIDRTDKTKAYSEYKQVRYSAIGFFMKFINEEFECFKEGTMISYNSGLQTKLNCKLKTCETM